MTDIHYATDIVLTADQFRDLLIRSTLGERRPIDNRECVRGMLEHADILATAWDGEKLVGISRSLTDWHYACYLSDLAVDAAYQRRGIGRQLIDLTQRKLGPLCKIILLAAPAAENYYSRVGFEHNSRAWVLAPNRRII